MNIDELLGDLDAVVDVPEQKSFNKPGKGRKQCPDCKDYVGARSAECKCGHNFNSDVKVKKPSDHEEITTDIRNYIFGLKPTGKKFLTIYFPNGKCPISVDGNDYESVKNFCEDVVDYGLKDSKLYLPSAIKYWLLRQVDPKHQPEVNNHINQWVKEVSNETR